jgi:hypothetical protein
MDASEALRAKIEARAERLQRYATELAACDPLPRYRIVAVWPFASPLSGSKKAAVPS